MNVPPHQANMPCDSFADQTLQGQTHLQKGAEMWSVPTCQHCCRSSTEL